MLCRLGKIVLLMHTKIFCMNTILKACLASAVTCLVWSCGTTPEKKAEPVATDTTAMKNDTMSVFQHLLVDNRKDPACGMPVSAGIGDTAHYDGKVLGFCSKECKDAFKKEPEKLIAAADLKK